VAGKLKRSSKARKAFLKAYPEKAGYALGKFYTEMEKAIELTEQDGFERGTTFCTKGEKIVMKPKCKGKECSVRLPQCSPGEEMYGDFHTHTGGNPSPSTGDYRVALEKSKRVSCIGAMDRTDYYIEGQTLEVPRSDIQCFGYDVDSPDFEKVRRKMLTKMEKAFDLRYKLLDKQLVDKKPISRTEWGKYGKMRDEISDMLADSDVFIPPENIRILRQTSDSVMREMIEMTGMKSEPARARQD